MSQAIRRDSYRNPNGVRGESPRTPGRGRGTGSGRAWRASESRTRELRPAPEGIVPSDRSAAVWAKAVESLTVSPATVDSWIAPARLLGELEGAICVEADHRVADWMRRRFAHALGESIRAQGMSGLRVFDRGAE